jgi:two-component system chemotaxis response regulator CheB
MIKAAAQAQIHIREGIRETRIPVHSPSADAGFSRPPAAVIAIGASTGGPEALQKVLAQLPADLPAGVLVVQHMPVGFIGRFAARLNHLCRVIVREAANGDRIQSGHVLVAPADWHMTVSRPTATEYAVRLSKIPAHTHHRPSVDVLMDSVAEVYGRLAMGIVLTGMGDDGVRGMESIHQSGGYTVGQDEASCAVYGMPRACAESGSLCCQAPLDQIASEICRATLYPQGHITP